MALYFSNNRIVERASVPAGYEAQFTALTEAQIAFRNANPTATASEVKAMQLIVAKPITNAQISAKRKAAYAKECDYLVIACARHQRLSEKATTEEERNAELAKVADYDAKILAITEAINARFPYNEET